MLIYKCDRCGKEIPRPDDGKLHQVLMGYTTYDNPDEENEFTSIDLCPSCWRSFNSWRVMYNDRSNEKEEE